MPKENEFYLQDTRSVLGDSAVFWKKGGSGYGTSLDEAEIFTFEEAQRYADRIKQGNHFVPLSKAQVDKLATLRVDMQILHKLTELEKDGSLGWVVQCRVGSYAGNDIYFLSESGATPNYGEATVFEYLEDATFAEKIRSCDRTIWSKAKLDKLARPTFQAQNINKRKMMTAAGIRYQSPRIRHNTGKTRGNCPECRKITWNYNPYENAYCWDHEP